jgi:hypothetical protein
VKPEGTDGFNRRRKENSREGRAILKSIDGLDATARFKNHFHERSAVVKSSKSDDFDRGRDGNSRESGAFDKSVDLGEMTARFKGSPP